MAKNSQGNQFFTFLSGILVGGVVGLLYAPDKGKNTRDKLTFKLDKYKKILEELIEELVSGKIEHINEAKTEGKRIVSETVEHAEKLMNEIDDLKNKIIHKN